ncbi:MAG: DUF2851 family protein [Rikenellaceae bacterium]
MNRAKLLSLIWRGGLFSAENITFYPVGRFIVRKRGMLSDDSAADIWGVTIEDTATGLKLSGDMKVDEYSSDWRKQNTIGNPEYDSVIFHLVEHRDTELINFSRNIITIQITPDPRLLEYAERIPSFCVTHFSRLNDVERSEILSTLLDDRIRRKTDEILALLRKCNGGWQETCYIHFTTVCGMPAKVKKEFEILARSLSYTTIENNRPYPPYIIAIFLGYAGLIPQADEKVDSYISELRHLWENYVLSNGDPKLDLKWQASKHRPISTPTLWLVRAASLIGSNPDLFEELLGAEDLKTVRSLLDISLPEYWHTHSTVYGAGVGQNEGRVSSSQIDILIINFVIPMLFARSADSNDDRYSTRASRFYEEVTAENFQIFKRWITPAWRPRTAFDSQGLLQLITVFCTEKRCAECPLFSNCLSGYHKFIESTDSTTFIE